jgi:P pilus assembly chaperone PapD
MQVWIRSLIAGAGALLVATMPASALLVQPMIINMSTTGAGATATLTIVNDRNRPDTIEVTVNKLTLPEDGAPVLTPDKGDDFLIFPPTVTIAPGKTQIVRIRWIGSPALAASQLYMFSTNELPVDQGKDSGVQVIYAVQSLVTVTSRELKPATTAKEAVRITRTAPAGPNQKPRPTKGVLVTFVNAGNGLDYATKHNVHLTVGAWSKTIESTDVSAAVGLGLIGADSTRKFFLPLEDLPPSGDIAVSLEDVKG